MKSQPAFNLKNVVSAQSTHKSLAHRQATSKPAAHRYERRKLREFLRHGVDAEEESLRFERFG